MLSAFLAGSTWKALGDFLAPFLTAFMTTFGDAVNDYFARKTADKNAQDLGAANAKLDAANDTIEAQQAELDAQANAPRSVDDAIKRLEDGTA